MAEIIANGKRASVAQVAPVVPPIDHHLLKSTFGRLKRAQITYRLGGKAELRQHNPRALAGLNAAPELLDHLDCSGLVRYLLLHASRGVLLLPDGSQNQRYWCELMHRRGALHQVTDYANIGPYMTPRRVFLGFIRPWTRGCGAVGHVWLVAQIDDDKEPDTLESYSGVGVGSRSWNSRTLLNQVYSVYELPVIGA